MPQTENLTVRQLILADLVEIADVHKAAYPYSALTAAGKGTIERYYRSVLQGPHHDVSAYGAFQNSRLVGFIIGGFFRGATAGFIRKNFAYLVFNTFSHPALWLNTNAFKQLGSLLPRLGRMISGDSVTGNFDFSARKKFPFGILSVAVLPDCRRQGIGRRLMAAAELSAVRFGYSEMELTVHRDNFDAVRFYRGEGWVEAPSGDQNGHYLKKRLKATAK